MATLAFPQNQTIDIMPYPQFLKAGSGKLKITSHFAASLSGVASDKIKTIEAATNRLLRRLNGKTLAYFEQEEVVLNKQPANATL